LEFNIILEEQVKKILFGALIVAGFFFLLTLSSDAESYRIGVTVKYKNGVLAAGAPTKLWKSPDRSNDSLLVERKVTGKNGKVTFSFDTISLSQAEYTKWTAAKVTSLNPILLYIEAKGEGKRDLYWRPWPRKKVAAPDSSGYSDNTIVLDYNK